MALSTADPVDNIIENLESLRVNPDAEDEEVKPMVSEQASDDGYISSSSTENLKTVGGGEKSDEEESSKEAESDPDADKKNYDDDDKKKDNEDEDDDDDDEKILEPLVIVQEKSDAPEVEFVSRGPVSNEHANSRFNPYARPDRVTGSGTEVNNKSDEAGTGYLPLPNILIPTKRSEGGQPTKINVKIEWSDNHELSIDKYRLPEDTVYQDGGNFIPVYVQLHANVKDAKSFLAKVKYEQDENGLTYGVIGPIVISLKTDLADSQEKLLLAEVSDEDRHAAVNLVSQKDISQLASGIGPNNDTVLAILCAQRKSNQAQVMAQIHAVVQRLLCHKDERVVNTIFRINSNGFSAFEIAAISNNSLVACYLAEVMYNQIDDTRTALKILNSKDSAGNTIIHLLARKGDSNEATLRKLLSMRLTDNTRVFTLSPNSKKQLPMHIAVQSQNQPKTIAVLHEAMGKAFELPDDDGMIPLHYACQRTADPMLVQTILSYKKDNINTPRADGLRALDLVQMRPSSKSSSDKQQMFTIDPETRMEIVKLLKNNGAVSSYPEPESPTSQARVITTVSSSTNSPHAPNSPNSLSPMGSPYDSSFNMSPCTLPPSDDHAGSGGYYSNMRVQGSVESYVQSSPESDHGEACQPPATRNYSFMPDMMGAHGSPPAHAQRSGYYNLDSPLGYTANTSLEDQFASQIFHEFPEIRNVLGQILDGNV